MATLTYQIQRYIVKQLACDVSSETIAEHVREQFLVELDAATVERYRPDADDASALSPPLRQLYSRTRAKYVAGT